MDHLQPASKFEELLGLERNAVAITFLDAPPVGIPHVKTPGPAGCAYWKLASDGEVFYTTAEDHLNCTIGAHTHGVSMPPEKSAELESTIGQMIGLNYLRGEEVAQIPHRKDPFHVAVYAPLSQSPCEPDVVVIRGNAKNIMLLTEAAMAAGIGPQGGIMVRPTCAFLPDTLQSGHVTPSFGCIGNRVYTALTDTEFYFAVPGSKVAELTAELEKIVSANQALEAFHQARCACA
jgi:uncharacterized protein (DUF169 family)